MTDYNAPLTDIRFLLNEVVGLPEIARLPGCEEATRTVSPAISLMAAVRSRRANSSSRAFMMCIARSLFWC